MGRVLRVAMRRTLLIAVVVALAAGALIPVTASAGTIGAFKGKWSNADGAGGTFGVCYGMAFSPYNGDLYVSDWTNNCIYEFNPDGTFVRKFGSAGTGNGQFNRPWEMLIDAKTGTLYVIDDNNNRIEYFSATGTYLGKWTGIAGISMAWSKDHSLIYTYEPGQDLVTWYNASTGAFVGSQSIGSTSGMGYHIAVSPLTGDLYLADFWTNYWAVRRYSTTTWEQLSWKLSQPEAIAIHPSTGNVVVTRSSLGQVDVLDADLAAVTTSFGSSGSADGQMYQPYACAFNPANGDLYVFEKGNSRVSYYGTYPTTKDIVPDGFSGSAWITVPGSEAMSSAVARRLSTFPGNKPFANMSVGTVVDLTPNVAPGGTATVTLAYPSNLSAAEEATVGLYHQVGMSWVEITTTVNTLGNTVSGTTTSFSNFAVLYESDPALVPASSWWSLGVLGALGVAAVAFTRRRRSGDRATGA